MAVTRQKQHSCVKIAVLRGRNVKECHSELTEALGNRDLPYRTVARWAAAFQRGRVASADMRRTGRPRTACTDVTRAMIVQRLEYGCANHDSEGKRFKYPIHCCDVTKPPYLFSGELSNSTLHCKLLFVYTVCCRRTGQCFSVLRTRKSDVILT